ncbi:MULTISPECIES: hypothetical protein [Paraburkholderia]|uniref:hypothetical protein n=1 Tax=Paraburkholderia TaxID=1822464 RepID=UPI0038BC2C20
MKEKLKLAADETLKYKSSRSHGFMGETDVTNYLILDASENIVGSVEHTEHTAVKGFRVTHSVVQKDCDGNVVVQTSWQP